MSGAPLTPAQRRALKAQYLAVTTRAGVYLIRHRQSGYTLVAGNLNVDAALARHRFELRQGCHRDATLQAAWRQDGEAAVELRVLDRVKPRPDPDFRVDQELALLVSCWQAEMADTSPPEPLP